MLLVFFFPPVYNPIPADNGRFLISARQIINMTLFSAIQPLAHWVINPGCLSATI
jgi:hypothetical protein